MKSKNGINSITIKIDSSVPTDQYELYKITNINGIAKPSLCKKNKILINLPYCFSLKDILSKPIDRATFLKIILRFADVFYSIIQLNLNVFKLELNLDYVFFNGNEIFIIYNPVATSFIPNQQIVINFFKYLSSQTLLINGDNCNRLFFDFINSKQDFEFTEYLNFIEENCFGLINSITDLNFNHIDYASINSGQYKANNFYGTYNGGAPFYKNSNNSFISEQDEGETVPLDRYVEGNQYPQYNNNVVDQNMYGQVKNNFDNPTNDFDYYTEPINENISYVNQMDETVPLDECENEYQTPQMNQVNFNQFNYDNYNQNIPYPQADKNIYNSGDTVVLNANAPKVAEKKLILNFVGRGKKVNVPAGEFYIGSDSACCNFAIENPSVSKMHLTIFNQNGDFYIRDNGSTNGTTLNGKKLIPRQPEKIENYDRILIADEIIDVLITED